MKNNISLLIGNKLLEKNLVLITAESCTAGLISSTVSETSGASEWLEGGFIVYTAEAKNKFLDVSFNTINIFDITSEEVAYEMALGAINNSYDANVSIAVTGLCGPNGGTKEIPVGTVCIAWAIKYHDKIHVITEKVVFTGSRNEIRNEVCQYSLEKLCDLLDV